MFSDHTPQTPSVAVSSPSELPWPTRMGQFRVDYLNFLAAAWFCRYIKHRGSCVYHKGGLKS